jgi:hypothetical protein
MGMLYRVTIHTKRQMHLHTKHLQCPSVHAITSKISPAPSSSGIEVLEAETFKLICTQTLTGMFNRFICQPCRLA